MSIFGFSLSVLAVAAYLFYRHNAYCEAGGKYMRLSATWIEDY